jgi:hypothetical protein
MPKVLVRAKSEWLQPSAACLRGNCLQDRSREGEQ